MPALLAGLFLGTRSYSPKQKEGEPKKADVRLINLSGVQVLLPDGVAMPTLPPLGSVLSLHVIASEFERRLSFRLAGPDDTVLPTVS